MAFQSRLSLFSKFALVTLALAVILGGGTTKWLTTDSIIILASLPLLGWALYRVWRADLDQLQVWAIAIAVAIIAIQAIHLIPLPPALWAELPGRDRLVEIYKAAAIELPWYPLSITPSATLHGLIASIPAFAIFLAFLTFAPREADTGAILIGGLGLACASLGLLQASLGETNLMRIQPLETHNALPIGFFANRNHTASFLAIAVLYLGWAATFLNNLWISRFSVSLVLVLLGFAICFLVLVFTLSRAGLALGLVAVVCTAFMYVHAHRKVSRQVMLATAGGLILMSGIVIQAGLVSLVDRFGAAPDAETSLTSRSLVTDRTMDLAHSYGPIGSGIGSFTVAYAMQERGAEIAATFMNQAHNDWAQLMLEGGLAGLAIALALIVWLIRSVSIRASELQGGNPARSKLVLVAAGGGLFLLAHSFVDYPLKTLSLQCIFAACCGLACLRAKTK